MASIRSICILLLIIGQLSAQTAGVALVEWITGKDARAATALAEDPALAHGRTADGRSLLHVAAAAENGPICIALLRAGADPYAVDRAGRLAQEVTDNTEIIRHLAAHAVPTTSACARIRWGTKTIGSIAELESQVAEHGRQLLTTSDRYRRQPLHYAAIYGDRDLVAWLIDQQVRLALADQRGSTPLHHAAKRGDPAIIAMLIRAGATIHLKDRAKDTPLQVAVKAGRAQAVKALVAGGAVIASTDTKLIGLAVSSGNTALLSELLDQGMSPLAANHRGDTPVALACRSVKGLATLRVLLSRLEPKQVAAARGRHGTALHEACRYRQLPQIDLLLQAGADPRAHDRRGRSPLQLAISQATASQTSELLNRPALKATLDHADANNWTALDLVRNRLDDEATKVAALLVAAGAPAAIPRPTFAMRRAMLTKNWSALRDLANKHRDSINVLLEDRRTLLYTAIRYGAVEAVDALLDTGATVNIRDRNSQTPVMMLSQTRDGDAAVRILKRLIAAKADLNLLDRRDRTVLDLAGHKHKHLISRLQRYGAKSGHEIIEEMQQHLFGANGF